MKTTTQDYLAQDFLIKVTFLAPTNSRGPRVKIASPYFKKSFIVPFNYEHDDGLGHLSEILLEKNIPVISRCALEDCDLVIVGWENGKKLFNI